MPTAEYQRLAGWRPAGELCLWCGAVILDTDRHSLFHAGDAFELRSAQPEDSHLVWTWANDPDTRKASFNQGLIPWNEHEVWFAAQRDLKLGWVGSVPVGSVRIDHEGEISVQVAPEHRRRGYGKRLIQAATLPGTRARIKDTNSASLRAFTTAGYTEISREDGVVEMVWTGLC